MDDIKTRDFQRISKMSLKELTNLPMFKMHEKDIWETAMAMASGQIPAKTAFEGKQWKNA